MAVSTPDQTQRWARNRQWLEAMAQAQESHHRLYWRNAVIRHNLALVRQVANRLSRQSGQPFDELVSAGNLGLIRAVEAFELTRHSCLSSFAVPYIRGAMLHDIRDNQQPLKTPRRLRELHQRAQKLISQRQQQGLRPHSVAALADALGCRIEQLVDAEEVQRALQVRSLDAPSQSPAGEASCLLDLLPSPPSPDLGGDPQKEMQLAWLKAQLRAIPQLDRALLEGHWLGGTNWKGLGLQYELSSQEAQRRGEAALEQLRQLGRAILASGNPGQHHRQHHPQDRGKHHGQQGGNGGLKAVHQLIAQPAEAMLQGGADPAFDQGGQQPHRGYQGKCRGARQQAEEQHPSRHQGAAGKAGRGALQADGPFGAGGHRPQAGDQHGVAAPAFANFAAEGVGQLGSKTGGKTHQQQRRGRRG